jgi:hypothetical protein
MTDIQHAAFCLPRVGETEPRIETYRAERTDGNGVVVARPRIERCIECGEQTVS